MADSGVGVSEILEWAMKREAEAHDFYMGLAAMVESEEMARVMEQLASEELAHEHRLRLVKEGDIDLCPDVVENTGVADHLAEAAGHAKMSYSELLLLGIQKEERSRMLYSSMAAAATNEQVREVLSAMAMEEANHKLRFEIEYELMTFRMGR